MKTIAYIALALALCGCSKAPEKLESPSMTIRAEVRGGKPEFTLTLTAALLNKTSDTAYLDYRAKIVFRDPEKSVRETPATVIPFEVARVYPFAAAPVRVVVTGSGEDFMPLFELLDMPANEVVKSGSTEDIFINEELVGLANISYRTADINSLLKERQNEKNK